MMVLEREKLLSNLKNIPFFQNKRHFPSLKPFELVYFYKHFKRNFRTIMAPLIEIIKGKSFKWTLKAQYAFKEMKNKLTHASLLALRCFDKIFEVNMMYLAWVWAMYSLKRAGL